MDRISVLFDVARSMQTGYLTSAQAPPEELVTLIANTAKLNNKGAAAAIAQLVMMAMSVRSTIDLHAAYETATMTETILADVA